MSSKEFIESIQFSRIETYSLFRKEIYKASIWKMIAERESLQKKQEQLGSLTKEEVSRLEELMELRYPSQVLMDKKGKFHPSSELITSLPAKSPEVNRLIEILKIPAVNIPEWMCMPTYRDAIAFYDEADQVIATLNICLGCDDMRTASKGIKADEQSYQLIKPFFLELGHPISDDER